MCNPHAHGMCILHVYTQVACHEAGAACVELLVDGPRHVVRRSTMGAVFRLFPWLGLSVESMVRVRLCACMCSRMCVYMFMFIFLAVFMCMYTMMYKYIVLFIFTCLCMACVWSGTRLW